MLTQPTPVKEDIPSSSVLYMAFDLGHLKWSIRFSDGQRVRDIQIAARDTASLLEGISKARIRFGLPPGGPIRSCYEAGLDGFWLHRFLIREGVENVVVDSASIEVNRRRRSAKTDRLDVAKLLELLVRFHAGNKDWSVVRVPSVEDEDARQLPREINRVRQERQRHRCRIDALLWTQGVVVKIGPRFEERLPLIRTWDGSSLPPALLGALSRELERLRVVERQLAELKAQRAARLAEPRTMSEKKAVQLTQLRGLGPTAGWTLATEIFGWRSFRNGKQVGKLSGLSPTPYNSGTSQHEQGIDKAGNKEIRRLMVQLAWGWLRYQPTSALTRWFQERFGGGGGRMRKIGIVALARKLLVALWHYLEHGIIPEGAVLSSVN
jgi:transposase